MSISATIKIIQDIMRKDAGVDGDAQRISQLVWMLFLKIFDTCEQEYERLEESYRSPIPERLRWRNWATDAQSFTGDELIDFIDHTLFKTLKKLTISSNPHGRMIGKTFEDAYNYMKNGGLLRQVINKLNEIDFKRAKEKQQVGEIYEKILKDLQSAGNAGEYYTPRAVTQFIVDRVKPQLGEVVLDPACGTGGFLTASIDYIRHHTKNTDVETILQSTIHGIEKKPLPYHLCMTNLLLHGIDLPAIEHKNTLAKSWQDIHPQDQVDVIITNPPFGGIEEDGIEENFRHSFRTKETAHLFLERIIDLLKKGGRGAIVLPNGALLGEGVKMRIKEKFFSECSLHTIVRLPGGVFNPYTNIASNLLFFTKGMPTTTIRYYEHPYPSGYKSYSKTKPIQFEEFKQEQDWWDNCIENQFSWKVSADRIKMNDYNLNIKNPYNHELEYIELDEVLQKYEQLRIELNDIQNQLKFALEQSLIVKN